jgi:hypothetical protein
MDMEAIIRANAAPRQIPIKTNTKAPEHDAIIAAAVKDLWRAYSDTRIFSSYVFTPDAKRALLAQSEKYQATIKLLEALL